MKKNGVLNIQLSQTIAALGHGDMLVIADAGLPVPKGVPCIDLAVCLGIPTLEQVLQAILKEVHVERITLAAPSEQHSTSVWAQAHQLAQDNHWQVDIVSHEILKDRSASARAIVRTGDNTPYTNIVLHSGVPF